MLDDDEFKRFLKTLGVRIRQLRKEKHLLMRDIMISTGYYDAQWRKYETGGSLNVASLLKIALALDVSLNELLDGLGQWPKLSVTEITERNGIRLDSETEPEPETKSHPSPQVKRSMNGNVKVAATRSARVTVAGARTSRAPLTRRKRTADE